MFLTSYWFTICINNLFEFKDKVDGLGGVKVPAVLDLPLY